jgi:hypothetical protein
MMDEFPGVTLLDHESAERFLGSCPLKALLFTKKTETPQLWVRVAEALRGTYIFGEVRHVEDALLLRFGVSSESLPRIVVVRDINGVSQTLHYEGATAFEKIAEFLRDIAEGGPLLVESRKQVCHDSERAAFDLVRNTPGISSFAGAPLYPNPRAPPRRPSSCRRRSQASASSWPRC